jgi:hypothetical protein
LKILVGSTAAQRFFQVFLVANLQLFFFTPKSQKVDVF